MSRLAGSSQKGRNNVVTVKKKKKIKWIVLSVVAVILIALIAAGTYFLTDMTGFGGSNTEKIVKIEAGSSTSAIAATLVKEGVIRSDMFFKVYIRLSGNNNTLYSGSFTLRDNMSYGEILNALSVPPIRDDLKLVTIVEGYRADQIAAVLEKAGICSAEDFMASVKNDDFSSFSFIKEIKDNPDRAIKIEGYLYPETYSFAPDTPAKEVVTTMLKLFDQRVPQTLRDEAKALGYTFDEMLTLASVIQLEAPEAEMNNVSAVFHNRLKWTDQPRYLGSTPTTGTVYGEKYDTNKYEGLPPGPFSNPSLAAIKAAMAPTANYPYYYFVTDKNMVFYYTKTYAEHNAIIAKLKSEGLWL